MDEYVKALKKLEKKDTQQVIKMSIYEGAGIVADEIKKEIKNLNVGKDLTKIEQKDLIKGFGISPMKFKNGDHDVKIGFDGYGSKPTKKYPKGVPIPLTARSIISGTSFRRKNNFVRRAVNKVKNKAIERMDEVLNEEIEKEMK